MTKDEFYEKYGQVKVKFSSYYKYTFTFEGTLNDGGRIVIDVGGSSGEIYRFEVCAGLEETISSLEPYSGVVFSEDKREVESFYS